MGSIYCYILNKQKNYELDSRDSRVKIIEQIAPLRGCYVIKMMERKLGAAALHSTAHNMPTRSDLYYNLILTPSDDNWISICWKMQFN